MDTGAPKGGDNIPLSPEAVEALARMGKNADSVRTTELGKKIDLGTHQQDRALENYYHDKGKVKPYVPDGY